MSRFFRIGALPVLIHQVGERNSLKKVVKKRIKLRPHGQCAAFIGSFAGIFPAFKAGHRRKGAGGQLENDANGIGLRRAGKPVASAAPAQSLHEPGIAESCKDTLEVFLR